ncbi:MAG TPA: hypothetical protein VGH09_03255 [Solirubrobacteraceae bacterium]|jgi:hypothetical protein
MRQDNARLPRATPKARYTTPTRPRATPKVHYGSLAGFYTADARRARSRERDVGLWWRDDVGGPLHRAAWIAETGELYLVRLGPPDAGGGEVEVLAVIRDRASLERGLAGWRERCGERRSLRWLRARAASLDARGTRRTTRAAPPQRVEAGGGTMLAAMSAITSELSRKAKPPGRAASRPSRQPTGRLAPAVSPVR